MNETLGVSTKYFSMLYKMSIKNVRAALIQSKVGPDKASNLENVSRLINIAKHQHGANLVCLSECFNSPYGTNFFPEYAETIPKGPSCDMLSKAAQEHSLYLVGGSIPELDDGKYYNTTTVWNPQGEIIAKYRKIHLFDISLRGGITFKESDILCPGSELVTFNIGDIKVGLGICYDLRFEEFAKLYRKMGCKLMIYPGAFTMVTGPLHWKLLQETRAVDNELYVFTISPARGETGYIAWGHSQITNPWGKVLAEAGHEEEIIYSDIDFTECDKMREQIPVYDQRRVDIYDTVQKSKY